MITGFIIVATLILLGLGLSFYLLYLTEGFEFDSEHPGPHLGRRNLGRPKCSE
jgi:hypothetical protein